MVPSVTAWTQQLRQHAAKCRAANPLPHRDHLTAAQEWECRIVGGTILTWLQQLGPQLLRERAVMAKLLGIDPDPAIVFTSDVPGLVAAQEIVGPDNERVLFLLHDEFDSSAPRAADSEYKWHLHFWSFFRAELDPRFLAQALDKHPIPSSCSYWQHTEGTIWALNAGRGVDHLWRWDGREPELLEEAMTHWVS